MRNIKVNDIVIIGGGSSGWLSAIYLLKKFKNLNVTLIESAKISTIGVGESTVAGGQSGFSGLGEWLRLIDINELEFMPHTDAIFKLSIAFENWYRKDSGTFHYPFGTPRFLQKKSQASEWNIWHLKKILYPKTPVSDFVEWFF